LAPLPGQEQPLHQDLSRRASTSRHNLEGQEVVMVDALRQRTVARVLFDEHHGEAWSTRAEAAARMRPSHPAAASYAAAAAELAARDFEVATTTGRPLDAVALAGTAVLVIAHPSDPRWERTVGEDSPVFSPAEIAAVREFVAAGGGLLVLGEEEEGRYGANLNELLAPFGLRFERTIVFDDDPDGVPSWVVGEASPQAGDAGLLHGVKEAGFYRAGSLAADDPAAVVLQTRATADPPGAALLAAALYQQGRVVAVADSDLFGDDYLLRRDNRQLWLNLVYWAGLAAFRSDATPVASEAAQDPAWLRLKDATNTLRLLQEPSGEVDLSRHDAGEVRALVVAMAEAIADLAPRFPHQKDYLDRVVADLDAWAEGGCGKPDFTESLGLFRPDLARRDGVEHLVVFPMYTPNASPDTRFEALITRTPWPTFVDQIERELYDNAKFVPVQLVDNTAGYDSECAVLFPETVSVAERPTNHFGGIFCDRESARYRRSTLRAAQALAIELPPDARALASSADLALETYVLWDMIHDRWHSHGDLPFDPFMIRQRLPYWMYSLEELRVDLATYGTAGELARGFPFARYVQYAILFDRLLRFPITGSRVRNYDGLGGQLLFGYLHHQGVVQWTDNRLLIDWDRVDGAVGDLRELVEQLYRHGIDTSKVTYWIAAHDLISRYVTPNLGSRWRKDARVFSDEADPRAWIDRVLDDEFPLNMFYETLKRKVAA
jgi:Family of unknown function (DUF6421)/Domain of unknown function (DUF4350)